MKTSHPRFSLFSFSLFLLFCLTCVVTANGEEYHYLEQKGKEIIPFTWKVENIGEKVRISVLKNGNSYISTCNNDGSTMRWKLTDIEQGNFEAIRVDNILTINGRMDGEPYEDAVGLSDQHWFQSLYYSLGKLVKSPYRDVSFWTIKEGDIVPVMLKARRKGHESVTVDGKIIQTQKIEVRSDNFFSKLWRGFYWFRESDNLLVKYRSEPGLPGAKETVVTLVSSP